MVSRAAQAAERFLLTALLVTILAATGRAQGGHIAGSPGVGGGSGHITLGSSSGQGTKLTAGSSWEFDSNNGFDWKVMGFGGAAMTTGLIFASYGEVGTSSYSSQSFPRCNPIWTCWPAPVAIWKAMRGRPSLRSWFAWRMTFSALVSALFSAASVR